MDTVTREELNGWGERVRQVEIRQENHDVKINQLNEMVPVLFKKMDENADRINSLFIKLAGYGSTVAILTVIVIKYWK